MLSVLVASTENVQRSSVSQTNSSQFLEINRNRSMRVPLEDETMNTSRYWAA